MVKWISLPTTYGMLEWRDPDVANGRFETVVVVAACGNPVIPMKMTPEREKCAFAVMHTDQGGKIKKKYFVANNNEEKERWVATMRKSVPIIPAEALLM